MDTYNRYLHHALIAQILNVASNLEDDKVYTKDEAAKDLVKIVDELLEEKN